jgi:transcriptional regulator with XRE-family HTH domain
MQDIGATRARDLVGMAARDILATRLSAAVSQDIVSDAAGMSRAKYGRIERGEEPEVSVASLARIGVALGQDLSLRFYPTGDAVRDAGQLALIERLRRRCHPSLTFHTEVPFPREGDRRAWDAMIRGFPTRRRCAVEAETRPTDAQALDRKVALKIRDGGADLCILLLADTRHNRAFVHGPAASLRVRFPLRGGRALELLAAGADPGENALILL